MYNNSKYNYYLFNILSGKILLVDATDENLSKLVRYIYYHKYIKDHKITDKEFVDTVLDISKKYVIANTINTIDTVYNEEYKKYIHTENIVKKIVSSTNKIDIHKLYMNRYMLDRMKNIYYNKGMNIDPISNVKDIVKCMSDKDKDVFKTYIKYQINQVDILDNVVEINKTKVSHVESELLRTFIKYLFHLQLNISHNRPINPMRLIKNMIAGNFVDLDDNEYDIVRPFVFFNTHMRWSDYKNVKSWISDTVKQVVDAKFDSNREFKDNLIINSKLKAYFDEHNIINEIKQYYEKYMHATDYKAVIHELYYLVCVMHAYYYNRRDVLRDIDYSIVDDYLDTYEKMNEYVKKLSYNKRHRYAKHKYLFMGGYIDMIYNNKLHMVSLDVSFDDVLELCILYLCMMKEKHLTNHVIYDFMYGCKYNISMEEIDKNYFQIMNIIAKNCNQKMRDVKLVYDLEATGLNPMKIDIIQICMKDYTTEHNFYSDYVKIRRKIPRKITKITRIKDSDLVGKPTLYQTRKLLKEKFENMCNCELIAHNGKHYDHKLMMYKNLLPMNVHIVFIDSLHCLKHKYPDFEKHKLGFIYKELFKCDIKGYHNAMADVDALIRILKYEDTHLYTIEFVRFHHELLKYIREYGRLPNGKDLDGMKLYNMCKKYKKCKLSEINKMILDRIIK